MKPTRRMLSALAVGVVFAFNAIPALATLSTISGYAYGEQVTTTTALGTTVTSGPLPTAGPYNQGSDFSESKSALAASVPGLLTTGLLEVATTGTTGETGRVSSTATVASVNALSGTLTADHVSAQCAVDSNGNTSGSSSLINAQLAGVALAAEPGPNTTVAFSTSLASGTATLNEQFYDPATNTLTVNAIHIRVTGGSLLGSATSIDIIISHVECDAQPGGAHPVIPEAPIALLLPLTALAVFGGAIFLSTRRGPATLRLGR